MAKEWKINSMFSVFTGEDYDSARELEEHLEIEEEEVGEGTRFLIGTGFAPDLKNPLINELNGGQVLLLQALCNITIGGRKSTKITNKQLGAILGASEGTVGRNLGKLEELNMIIRESQNFKGFQGEVYTIRTLKINEEVLYSERRKGVINPEWITIPRGRRLDEMINRQKKEQDKIHTKIAKSQKEKKLIKKQGAHWGKEYED